MCIASQHLAHDVTCYLQLRAECTLGICASMRVRVSAASRPKRIALNLREAPRRVPPSAHEVGEQGRKREHLVKRKSHCSQGTQQLLVQFSNQDEKLFRRVGVVHLGSPHSPIHPYQDSHKACQDAFAMFRTSTALEAQAAVSISAERLGFEHS